MVATATTTRGAREWIFWFLKLRVVIYTVILGILIGVEKLTAPSSLLLAVLAVLIAALLSTLVFALWAHYRDNYKLQALCQVVVELIIISVIICLTGGAESYFSILYLLTIVYSSVVLFQWGATLTAFSSTFLYATLLLLIQADIFTSPASTRTSLRSLLITIALNGMAMLVVGYFSGYLAENLSKKGVELIDKADELASLMAVNENIIQSMRGGLLTTDLDGSVAMLNPAGEEIIGRLSADVLKRPLTGVFADVDFEECIRMLSDGSRNVRLDSILDTPSGEKFVGLSISPLYRDQTTLTGYLVNFQDLTELKRLEHEIRAKDRMAALGEMAAGMAHEIRNPLASIAGSASLLRREATLNEDQSKLMNIVFDESERLNKIINDFLIYSRQDTYNPREVDLNQLMDDTVALLYNNPEVTEKHRIQRQSDQRPLPCLLDPDLIRQVFWNLSHNAIRAMPDGGTLTIELKKPQDREVRIVFRDTGIGIEEDRIDKIFEPFHSSFVNGTGLGLAIVYQIIQAHQGRIEVRSTAGLGSEFEITLPCSTAV